MIFKRIWILTAFVLLGLSASLHSAPPLSGAIFTTDAHGNVVNGNIYDAKCDVYLDGGPGPNAPPNAASLPDGDYYFQVTDPSGQTLLSTDSIGNREFTVEDGLIKSHSGTHGTNSDSDYGSEGAIVIQLCPYLDTPNPGGVYKVWVTPVEDYVAQNCGNGCFHGFLPRASKTDNFKVRNGDGKQYTFCLKVYKDINMEGKKGDYLEPGVGWEIDVSGPVSGTIYTNKDGYALICNLTEGTYTVTESLSHGGNDYTVIWTEHNGNAINPPTNVVQFPWNSGGLTPQVIYFVNEEIPCKKKDCKNSN